MSEGQNNSSNLIRILALVVGVLFIVGIVYGKQIVGLATGSEAELEGCADEALLDEEDLDTLADGNERTGAPTTAAPQPKTPPVGPSCPNGTTPADCLEQLLTSAVADLGQDWSPSVSNCVQPTDLADAETKVGALIQAGFFKVWKEDDNGDPFLNDEYNNGFDPNKQDHADALVDITSQLANAALGGDICEVDWGGTMGKTIGIVTADDTVVEIMATYSFASLINAPSTPRNIENGFGADVCTYEVELDCNMLPTKPPKGQCKEAKCNSEDLPLWEATITCGNPYCVEGVQCQMQWGTSCASGTKYRVGASVPVGKGKVEVKFEGWFGSAISQTGYESCNCPCQAVEVIDQDLSEGMESSSPTERPK